MCPMHAQAGVNSFGARDERKDSKKPGVERLEGAREKRECVRRAFVLV